MYGTHRNNDNNNNNNVHGGGDDQSSSSSEADFMTHPFQAFRPSLFTSLKSPPDDGDDGSEEIAGGHNDTLPSLHDKSWIGARMSPIHSYNDNDGDDEENFYRHYTTRQPLGFGDGSLLANPSAGHNRKEYPPFGIHPLQPIQQYPLSPVASRSVQTYSTEGTLLCVISGLSLLSMAVYDLVFIYLSRNDSQRTLAWDTSWSLPFVQPSDSASIVWGALVPSKLLVLQEGRSLNHYWRLISSALQSNSLLEWCCLALAWFVCQRPSVHSLSWQTTVAVYTVCTLTGQLWMLAVWLLYNNSSTYQVKAGEVIVAHCAAWGTSGVLCFVGMLRPHRRFSCFMISIVLVILSLLQCYWRVPNPLPNVVGCTASSFVGWALYGSHLLVFLKPPQQLSPQMLLWMTSQRPPNPSIMNSPVRLCSGIFVVLMWTVPLLIIAYLDYWQEFRWNHKYISGGVVSSAG